VAKGLGAGSRKLGLSGREEGARRLRLRACRGAEAAGEGRGWAGRPGGGTLGFGGGTRVAGWAGEELGHGWWPGQGWAVGAGSRWAAHAEWARGRAPDGPAGGERGAGQCWAGKRNWVASRLKGSGC
jgi:hypothetical protein